MHEKILHLMNRSRALTSSRTVMEFQNTRNAPLRRTYSTYTLSPRRGRLSPSAATTTLLWLDINVELYAFFIPLLITVIIVFNTTLEMFCSGKSNLLSSLFYMLLKFNIDKYDML